MAARQIRSGAYLRRQQARLRLRQLDIELAELLRLFPDLAAGGGNLKSAERTMRPMGPSRAHRRGLPS